MTLLRTVTIERPSTRLQSILREHRAVLEAIERHDPDAARAAMRHHVQAGLDRLFEGQETG